MLESEQQLGRWGQSAEHLIYYFTGELDRIIETLEKKLRQQYSDDVYNATTSYRYRAVVVKIHNHADPTGEQATKLADLYLERKRKLNYYHQIKRAIDGSMTQICTDDINILKGYLGLEDNLTGAARNAGISYGEAINRSREMIRAIGSAIIRDLINIGW